MAEPTFSSIQETAKRHERIWAGRPSPCKHQVHVVHHYCRNCVEEFALEIIRGEHKQENVKLPQSYIDSRNIMRRERDSALKDAHEQMDRAIDAEKIGKEIEYKNAKLESKVKELKAKLLARKK